MFFAHRTKTQELTHVSSSQAEVKLNNLLNVATREI